MVKIWCNCPESNNNVSWPFKSSDNLSCYKKVLFIATFFNFWSYITGKLASIFPLKKTVDHIVWSQTNRIVLFSKSSIFVLKFSVHMFGFHCVYVIRVDLRRRVQKNEHTWDSLGIKNWLTVAKHQQRFGTWPYFEF